MTAEKKILLCLGAFLLLLEAGTRIAEPHLSKDLAHIRSFPEIAEKFATPAGEVTATPMKILVLGNSLARCGVDEQVLRDGLQGESESAPVIAFMTADGTGIVEWAWGYRRYILHEDVQPDLVLLLTGPMHLVDPTVSQLSLERLGAFFLDSRDRSRFFEATPVGAESRLDLQVAAYSRLAVDRSRLRPLLFYRTVSGYTEAVEQINIALGGGIDRGAADQAVDEEEENDSRESARTKGLRVLLDSVQESGSRMVVVSVPLPASYQLPEAIDTFLGGEGVSIFRFGDLAPFEAELFPDGYHLNETGADRLTSLLVDALLKQVLVDE